MKMVLLRMATLVLFAGTAAFAETQAIPRPRRILYNLDGDSCLTLKAGRNGPGPMTAADLTNIVAELTRPGSQVDTLLVCVNAQVMYYPTKVGTLRGTSSTPEERAKWSEHERQRYANVQAFFEAGIDPYAVILGEAKRRGLEALLTFRVNDAHGNDFLRTAFWRDHPEYRLGNGALDFTHDAVRDYVFRLIEEAVQRYDCDGLELDFQRFPTFFKAGTKGENTPRINALVERVRQMLDAEGVRRGRRLELAARAPSDYGQAIPTCEQSRAPAKACDPAEWAQRGWIDFLTVSEFLFTSETLGLESWRQVVRGVPIYAAIQPETKPSSNAQRCEYCLGAAGYRKYALERWTDGADGIYLFNFFTPREWPQPTEPSFEVLAQMGDPKTLAATDSGKTLLEEKVGRPADVAGSAYAYRADRPADANPPESWILLTQYAGLPYDKPVDVKSPPIRRVLCGLLWEEVRPVRRVELVWPRDAGRKPSPGQVALVFFDATDSTAHTWWNPRTLKEAGPPEVSADGRTYSYAIPVDTWGMVAVVRGDEALEGLPVPTMRALVSDRWKRMDLEIEWGFDETTASLPYDGRVEAYDGILGEVKPLAGDKGTVGSGPQAWRSTREGNARRGVQLSTLYLGTSRWRHVWPYHAQAEDVARSILTVWTRSGSFSFQVSDLEQGPILAPEFGFFVRGIARAEAAAKPAEAAWSTVSAKQTLSEKFEALPGVPKVRGWAFNGLPWFGVNASTESGMDKNLKVPARSVAMHPMPDRDVAVGWRSPIRGRVAIKGRAAMGDATGGNGIEWFIVCERQAGRQTLAHGVVDPGASQAIPAPADAPKLAGVSVEAGDRLALVVGARDGNHFCDTTLIEFTLAEVGGQGRVWSLAQDVLDNIHSGNPHADGLGNAEVWHFHAVPAGRTLSPPAASEPPFSLGSSARTAKEFVQELSAKGRETIRQRTRAHAEQTWEQAVAAMQPGAQLPPHPGPAFEPAMKMEVPCARLTAQWKLGAWHILRRSVKGQDGRWRFNDYPFGILASETYMILRALDLQGLHREAADGLDQWLRLPLQPKVVPGSRDHHGWALPDRPLGHFSEGQGCLTHAEGIPGLGGHMDGVHAMGPGAIMFACVEHFRLTGDLDWLKANAPRMMANVEWILRQRRLLGANLPGGDRLWSKGLQPAHVVTPDSERMHMQFYESEAYYWLAARQMAELLTLIEPKEGQRLAAEAEAYRRDLLAAIDRSITLTPVVPVRDGTYRSFIPFAPYVRGFAAGAWGWRRCQGHVGAIYWDTVQSADPLISPSGLLSPQDPRVQGHLDVLEDRLLLENTKVNARTAGFDPEKHWFAHASWQYQCGLERHANIHLAADDIPNFLRSMLNQYAVDIMPGEYTFREHTTGGPPDKIYEESCFLERFRQMLVMEEGDSLWLARATPRAWFEQGRKISVNNAPTHFGVVSYVIVSDVDHRKIDATVTVPPRTPPARLFLRFRHPESLPVRTVIVNGKPWGGFDAARETVELKGLNGPVTVTARY